MVLIPVRCPHCGSDQVVKRGKTENAKQRYLCQQQDCPIKTFILDYDYNGCLPEVKQQIIDRALNGSGIRDTAHVLKISPTTVIKELKKRILPGVGQQSLARNTQKIERKHLTLRTRIKRLVRKTICFSKLKKMHDIVIGLFINRYEFGVLV